MSERFHFEHTFQTLQEHHFIREGFSNDFAHWAFAACNEIGLAERLAAIDVREFTSISDLRNRLVAIVEDYLKHNPSAPDRAALEPFYFCATDTVVIPTPFVARNLVEFIESLKKVSIHSIHHHYIDARLRIKLNSNDFSMWLEKEMDLGPLADRLNRIDIYTSTLYDVHDQIVRILERAAQPTPVQVRRERFDGPAKESQGSDHAWPGRHGRWEAWLRCRQHCCASVGGPGERTPPTPADFGNAAGACASPSAG